MKVKSGVVGDVTVLCARGKITIGKGDLMLRDAIESALKSGYNKIILDLSGVTYMDSAGIGQLVTSTNHVLARGGRLVLLRSKEDVKLQDLLQLTKLEEFYETYDSILDALAAL